MSFIQPLELRGHGLVLVPLALSHETGLRAAAADGELWNLRVTSVPTPATTQTYIENALRMREQGSRMPFAVLNAADKQVLGCTSYHDIVPAIPRVEIGYTWYARRWQRTHVNTACKLLLLDHAFGPLACQVVGWRTDALNEVSQRAIERLGAHKDGVLRCHAVRTDGSVRDTVMYSLLAQEWPQARSRLLERLRAHPHPAAS